MIDQINNNQQTTTYDKGYKWLHWLMAALVILMFMATFGFAQANTDAAKIEMLTGHSSIGSVIFLLFVIRFCKRFIFKSPRPKHELAPLTNVGAKVGHLTLYSLLFYVPVTGYLSARAHELPVYWFGQLNLATLTGYQQSSFEMIRSFHQLGVQTLMVVVVLHIAAAVFHGLVKRDGVFSSMWPDRKTKSE
ncbi:cytochrome b [Colwellia psychrerythraea]|uniref:Di-heme cytochrome, transmembrane n=1 Tax=Colwellia psychrerythraea TaxID=28229 RepID=A0A099KL27_COLPS|nr:cytochrome b/b6 domain-containing protein [Colwellia psychrerythraea]KGJ90975.1 Di-heme cytochrome, transmembrane [Colwellia psychrerythraea]